MVVHFSRPALSNVVSLKGLYWVLYCLTNSYSRMYTDDTNINYADKDVKCEYHSVPFEYRFAKYQQMADR